MAKRTIVTDYLARVEGEGAMTVQLDGDRVERVFSTFNAATEPFRKAAGRG